MDGLLIKTVIGTLFEEYTANCRIVPIIGSGVFSAGVLGTFIPISTYLIDAYSIYSASALAANSVLRSLTGALLPLAGPKMVSPVTCVLVLICSSLYWVLDGGTVCLHLLLLLLRLYRGLFIDMESI